MPRFFQFHFVTSTQNWFHLLNTLLGTTLPLYTHTHKYICFTRCTFFKTVNNLYIIEKWMKQFWNGVLDLSGLIWLCAGFFKEVYDFKCAMFLSNYIYIYAGSTNNCFTKQEYLTVLVRLHYLFLINYFVLKFAC